MKEIVIRYPSLADELTAEVMVVHGDYPKVRKAIKCRAIWDTGASETTVNAAIVRALQLEKIDAPPRVSHTANGDTMSHAYKGCLVLANDWPPLVMRLWEMPPSDVDVLIGMDIIGRGQFNLWPEKGQTVLKFELDI
jgi:hypothetical protein